MKNYYFNSHDNEKIFLHTWEDVENPIGVIQIFHGMAEHAARYDHFAKYLNSKGYIVFADDHRGHGKTAESIETLGYIGDHGFDKIVEDEYFITKQIKSKYPSLPIFIFAHSFGSFVGQEFINRYSSEVNGVILSGSAKQSGIDFRAGLLVTSFYRLLGKDSKKNAFLESIIFGGYNKKEKDNNSKFAWLSADKEQVKKYEDDPYCGTIFTTNFYHNMFTGFKHLYLKEKQDNIDRALPILIISGEMDPVGKYGKMVKELFTYYNNLGVKDVSIKLYPNGRHELINEVNNSDVYKYISEWIDSKI